MAITIQELNNRFSNLISDLQGPEYANIIVGIGLEARQKIFTRYKDFGVSSDGQKLAYSTKPMLVGCKSFRKADCNTFFNSPSIEWVSKRKPGVPIPAPGKHNKKSDYWRLAVLEGGYKKLREISGRQSNHVDFIVSGQMWNGITIKKDKSQPQKGLIVIGAVDEEARKKLEGNTARFGDILKLSSDELLELSQSMNERIAKMIKKNGLQ